LTRPRLDCFLLRVFFDNIRLNCSVLKKFYGILKDIKRNDP